MYLGRLVKIYVQIFSFRHSLDVLQLKAEIIGLSKFKLMIM